VNLAILDDPRWQTQMDPLADTAAATIITRGGVPAMSLALELLSAVPPEKPWPAGLEEYVEQTTVPTGVDWTRVKAAQDWFNTWGVLATASLFCASLPETYCIPGMAALLALSHQLTDHVTRRIVMTGQMLFEVMTPGAFALDGRAVQSLRRTRLMHAAIRVMLLDGSKSGKTVLVWTDKWGQPINQLELVYTLLTFSHVVLRSVRILGVAADAAMDDAYNYAWNVAGQVIGVHPDLLPDNAAEAAAVFEHIKVAHKRAGANDYQRALMAALEVCWKAQFSPLHVPFAVPTLHWLFETLLSDETRAILGVARPPALQEALNTALRPILKGTVVLVDEAYRHLPPAAQLAAAVNHFFAVHITEVRDGGLYDTQRHMRAWSEEVSTERPRSENEK
jgi:ER-bound oxygenase mpaB/B'/Rubber oxygenase, catalytic domain